MNKLQQMYIEELSPPTEKSENLTPISVKCVFVEGKVTLPK